jgi:hypothetical protein
MLAAYRIPHQGNPVLDLTAFTSIVARARVADQPIGSARHNPTRRSPVQPLVDRR